jgi:hypothetical protein
MVICLGTGSLLTEVLNGGSPDLVPKSLTFTLSFEDDEAYSRYESITNDYL